MDLMPTRLTAEQRKKLTEALIECRVQNIRNNSAEAEWMADVMGFGWIGYDAHTDADLLSEAKELGVELPK